MSNLHASSWIISRFKLRRARSAEHKSVSADKVPNTVPRSNLYRLNNDIIILAASRFTGTQ